MTFGMRPRPVLPLTYKDYGLFLGRGLFYGIPSYLDTGTIQRPNELLAHPSVLKAGTLKELEALIDKHDGSKPVQERLECYEGYELIRHRGSVCAVPRGITGLDLDVAEECQQVGVLVGATVEEVQERIRLEKQAVPVEFTGWLPIVKFMGNCGQHPQFKHTDTPPRGYRFTRGLTPKPAKPSAFWRGLRWLGEVVGVGCLGMFNLVRPLFAVFQGGPRVSVRSRLRILGAVVRLFLKFKRNGAKLRPIIAYLRSRNFASQMLIAEKRGLLFLASAPYTFNQNPWMIEIEDPTTLFYPFIQNGMTCDLDMPANPYFPIIKAQLEDERCKGIITHIRSTARMLTRLFDSDRIARKVIYIPLGVKAPSRWQRHERPEPEHINLLFINSWCQHSGNLHVRGGLDILEAFAILRERYPHVRLTMRTSLPNLDEHYHRIIESGWVRVINRFQSVEEMEALHAESHIFLLPSARIHIVSLLQAMASGLAVVTSDGWGIEEYITNERNGLVVKGRYGVTSWADEEAGLLRENYTPCYTADPEMVQRIVEAVSRLIEDAELRRRLGRTARHDVETTYNLDNWNEGLKQALDSALGVEQGSQIRKALEKPMSCPV